MEQPTTAKKTRKTSKEKKRQLALTNRWLDENYSVCDGVCIPRCILYSHYMEFCQLQNLPPACAATFGKIIRQKFPNITTRRLGTRGHSKYHYYGVCIKETSQYYHTVTHSAGLTRFSGCKMVNEGGFTKKYSLVSKIGATLPEFPNSLSFMLPIEICQEQFETLLVMYRTHCQCVLNTIISGSFAEVATHLMNFWHSLPGPLKIMVEHPLVINVVSFCDSLLYNSLIDVLIPASMQEVSEQLLVDIQQLAHHWCIWLSHSMAGMSEHFAQSKLSVAKRFSQSLRRQAAFLHLTQLVRPILYDCNQVNTMIMDVITISFTGISKSEKQMKFCENELLVQFKEVLQKQATVEALTEWLDYTIDRKVIKHSNGNLNLLRKKAQEFFMVWSQFGCKLMQLLTENKARSQTSVNLIRLLADEYIMVAIETQLHEQENVNLISQIKPYLHPERGGFLLFPYMTEKYNNSLQSFSSPLQPTGSDSYEINFCADVCAQTRRLPLNVNVASFQLPAASDKYPPSEQISYSCATSISYDQNSEIWPANPEMRTYNDRSIRDHLLELSSRRDNQAEHLAPGLLYSCHVQSSAVHSVSGYYSHAPAAQPYYR